MLYQKEKMWKNLYLIYDDLCKNKENLKNNQ